MKFHNDDWCDIYQDQTLPNEEGRCSLCDADLRVPRFLLGRTLVTKGAVVTMNRYMLDASKILSRHVVGDWGDLDEHDKQVNEKAVAKHEGRILSAYGTGDRKLWVITESDWSVTTILRPDEY